MKTAIFLVLMMFAGVVQAQTLFQEHLFPADVVMRNREKIALSEAQAERIKRIHGQNAAEFANLKWDLDAETEKMKKLLAESKVQAAAVQKQMDVILALEGKLKSKQLATLVAIKNELSENQQTLLSRSRVILLRDTLIGLQSVTDNAIREIRMRRLDSETNTFDITTGAGRTPAVSRIIVDSNFSPNATRPVYYLKEGAGYIKIESLDAIAPSDIQSVSVLKDKSSTDLFGEEGKNGAIVITLKPKENR